MAVLCYNMYILTCLQISLCLIASIQSYSLGGQLLGNKKVEKQDRVIPGKERKTDVSEDASQSLECKTKAFLQFLFFFFNTHVHTLIHTLNGDSVSSKNKVWVMDLHLNKRPTS